MEARGMTITAAIGGKPAFPRGDGTLRERRPPGRESILDS
jgi:hypothetical protein